MKKTFLTGEWRKLVMFNYEVDPEILKPYLPVKTELDFWDSKCYVSLVGFMFLNTKVRGFKIPYHCDFEEVNLRFYVRYFDPESPDNFKRGVVFIKEIVPKRAIAFVANTVYKEPYVALPMGHSWITSDDHQLVSYKWKKNNVWNLMSVKTEISSCEIENESEEEFITEHFWGYTKFSERKTSQYEVTHPRWNIYKIIDYSVDVDFAAIYGNNFAFLGQLKPISVFLAEGSEIAVKGGGII